MAEVRVVGAGLGGLAAALELAVDGHAVEVVEALPGPGGKAGVAVVDGVEFDTGPSVLTLPEVFDGLLRKAGTSLAAEVELVAPEPAFRYLWPDGAVFDVFVAPEATLASARACFGPRAADELRAFLAYARRVWENAAPEFVFAPLPGAFDLMKLGFRAVSMLSRIDPFRSFQAALDAQIHEPHLRDVLLRYATYNGSDPRRAPATLHCIAHVELSLGGWGVAGGIHALVRALVRLAEARGVRFRYGEPVRELRVEGGRVRGLVSDRGAERADLVVCNADVGHLLATLLPRGLKHGIPTATPSTSGWNQVWRAARRERVAHTVLFPRDYAREFVDLFDEDRPPGDPTVYLCAQEKTHRRAGWPQAEPLFVMANAPAEPTPRPGACDGLRERVRERLRESGLLGETDELVWERSPSDLARLFPGSAGALYGAASNSMTAAFTRPHNRVPGVAGLYLASGSAHPGGGMPLCVQSGRLAARCAREDQA